MERKTEPAVELPQECTQAEPEIGGRELGSAFAPDNVRSQGGSPAAQRHGAMTMFSGLAVWPSTVSEMDTVPWPRRVRGKIRLSWSSPTKVPCGPA